MVPHKPSVEQFLKKGIFLPNCAIFDIFAIWANFLFLGASIRVIPCSGGQYVSFGTHMSALRRSFKISNFRKIKRGSGRFCMSANLRWFKVCFLSSGDNMLLLVPHKLSVEQFFQKIVFRQTPQISKFSPFGRNSAIWELQHVLFLAQGTKTLLLVLHMPTLKQSFKISNFRKIKKGRSRFCMFTNV